VESFLLVRFVSSRITNASNSSNLTSRVHTACCHSHYSRPHPGWNPGPAEACAQLPQQNRDAAPRFSSGLVPGLGSNAAPSLFPQLSPSCAGVLKTPVKRGRETFLKCENKAAQASQPVQQIKNAFRSIRGTLPPVTERGSFLINLPGTERRARRLSARRGPPPRLPLTQPRLRARHPAAPATAGPGAHLRAGRPGTAWRGQRGGDRGRDWDRGREAPPGRAPAPPRPGCS